MNLTPMATIAGMNLGEEPDVEGGFSLVPKVLGQRRLLMNLLKQDPKMAEMLKTLRMKGDPNGSMGTGDFSESGQ